MMDDPTWFPLDDDVKPMMDSLSRTVERGEHPGHVPA